VRHLDRAAGLPHAGIDLPDLDGLLGFELLSQAVPRLLAGIGHRFDQVHMFFLGGTAA
jgi:hypothetical protein